MACIDTRYPGTYRVRISIPGSPRLTKTFKTLEAAQQWADEQEKLIHQVLEAADRKRQTDIQKTQIKPGLHDPAEYILPDLSGLSYETPKLFDALTRYEQEVTIEKRSQASERNYIRRWQAHPLASFPLLAIRGHHLATHRNARIKAGIAGNTIRLELALLSHLYKVARTDWGYEELTSPTDKVRKPRVSRGRSRRLVGDEEERLLRYCIETGDQRLHSLIILAVETAMRRGEMVGLAWSDVDLPVRMVYLDETKNGEARTVPLSKRAVAALKAMPKTSQTSVVNLHADNISGSFREACKACGIEGLRFHDLRHEAASRLFEKGLNVMQVAAITGHRSMQMLKRYTHLRPVDLLELLN
jgi:integrase